MLSAVRAEYRSLLTTTVCAAVIAAAGVAAILFVAVAIFLSVDDAYGRVEACLAMAALFAAVALIVAVALLLMHNTHRQRLAVMQAETPKERPAWLDPALIPVGLEAAKLVVRNRGLLYVLLGSAAIGWLMSHPPAPARDEPAAEPAE